MESVKRVLTGNSKVQRLKVTARQTHYRAHQTHGWIVPLEIWSLDEPGDTQLADRSFAAGSFAAGSFALGPVAIAALAVTACQLQKWSFRSKL
jgi:hypothetical protein